MSNAATGAGRWIAVIFELNPMEVYKRKEDDTMSANRSYLPSDLERPQADDEFPNVGYIRCMRALLGGSR